MIGSHQRAARDLLVKSNVGGKKMIFLLGNFFVSILWIVLRILPRSLQKTKYAGFYSDVPMIDRVTSLEQHVKTLGTFWKINHIKNQSYQNMSFICFSPIFKYFNQKMEKSTDFWHRIGLWKSELSRYIWPNT